MTDRFYEDFKVGDRFMSGGMTITEAAIIDFARQWDPQPFHTDPAFAAKWTFGGLIASGLHTMAATLRLLFTLDSALLLPMYAFSGFELAFWTGEFTQLLTPGVIGLVLAFSGVGEVVGGLAFGRLSDSLGRSASITLAPSSVKSSSRVSTYGVATRSSIALRPALRPTSNGSARPIAPSESRM